MPHIPSLPRSIFATPFLFVFIFFGLPPQTSRAQVLCVDGGGAGGCPTSVTLGGRNFFDSVTVTNNGVIYVTAYNGTDKQNTGNLEIIAPSITIDNTSSINADGRGYSTVRCGDGRGPTDAAAGQGGCAVFDSGGGGAHFGNGGRGTKDMSSQTPALRDWEEDCTNSLNAGGTACSIINDKPACWTLDALPTVAGQEFFHSIWQAEFGAAGGDKGCRDGDGFGGQPLVAGFGGGRIVLAGITDTGLGTVNIQGTVRAMGWRGCGTGNDSAGGGAGGSILIIGDSVTMGASAKVWAAGGTGGDTQNLNGTTYYSIYRGQSCPVGAQTGGTCDDCGGGGGGGIVAVMSRAAASIAGTADFDVNGAIGGSCTRCKAEAGGQAGELQLSYGYKGEICDGWDNDFDSQTDEGLGTLSCTIGSCTKEVAACTSGQLGYCIDAADPNCLDPDPDTRPRFALIVDTSGSMLTTLDARHYVFGDGSAGHEGRDIDLNGKYDDSRLYQAKNALSQVIAAYPEVDWSLLRYHQDQGEDRSCQQAAWFECASICCTYDNPVASPPSGPVKCTIKEPEIQPDTDTDTVQDLNVYAATDAAPRCIHYAGTCGSVGNGADVLTGFGASINDYIMWLDHTEDDPPLGISDVASGSYCSNHDCELRGTGPTPLADSLLAARRYLEGARRTDPYSACRPYKIILLTDGTETCNGNPVTAAQTLYTAMGIETLVIGFSVTPAEKTQLNQIARAGSGNLHDARSANNEAELASTLATIVADSIIYEECNGLDDDCDSFTDEDFPDLGQPCDDGGIGICRGTGHYICSADGAGVECNITTPGQSPAAQETCNGLDDNCNGQIDEGTCDDCVPTGQDICDGVDNDCDGETDEGFVPEACGVDEGECEAGLTECLNGALTCDGTGSGTEICNNKDDDCDGLTDGIYVPCYPSATIGCSGEPLLCVGECQPGQALCTGGVLDDCEAATTPQEESCDGYDNDCDGETDELYDIECWTGFAYPAQGICHPGTYDCIAPDTFSDCEGEVIPQDEICNGLDDDCDGSTDEVTEVCGGCDVPAECPAGPKAGQCEQGVRHCDIAASIAQGTPVWQDECEGEVGPQPEICNGLDDDCDGITDEVTIPCGGCDDPDPVVCPAGPDEGRCREGIARCDSAAAALAGHAVWKECVGSIPPSLEVCDGEDNDCDGETDEGLALVGQVCRKQEGVCLEARLMCVSATGGGKTIACCTGVETGSGECIAPNAPTAETCDNLDNNCDSLTDEGLVAPCGGCEGDGCTTDPSQGECQEGLSRCVAGKWGDCQGSKGPSPESCNLLDDDCDGAIDEDLVFTPPTCSDLNIPNPEEGICTSGTYVCVAGQQRCVGGQGPQLEVCNGDDDDCDGLQDWDTDEEVQRVGEPCGLEGGGELGECKKGAKVCECDPDLGTCDLECVGVVEPLEVEICNCKDDDCDGQTDEDIPAGAACVYNPDVGAIGACTEGAMRCIDCDWKCDAPGPGVEACNGVDDDCDGATDEELDLECPSGNLCVEGECAPPCAGQEASCPGGMTCEEVTNPGTGETMRVCLDDVCAVGTKDALLCADNPYYCSDEGASPPCKCDALRKECLRPCEGMECQPTEVCIAVVTNKKVSAQCVEAGPGCYATFCESGKKCEDGTCVDDPCSSTTCEGDAYCKDGTCVDACVNQDCPVSCRDGECVDDPCAGKVCDVGLSCHPQTGKCERGDCWGVVCAYYEVCKDGQCVADPCRNVDCPNGRRCVDGSCYALDYEPGGGGPSTDATDDDTTTSATDSNPGTEPVDTDEVPGVEENELTKVLATGAGGCLCAATPGRSGSTLGWLWLVVLTGIAVLLRARRPRGKALAVGLGALALFMSLGCQVEPFEFGGLGNTDGTDTTGTDTGGTDTSGTGGTDGTSTDTDGTGTESGTCEAAGSDDECNGVDDDCDGKTDEDANLASLAHCGSCSNVCSYEHAYAACEEGKCKRGACATFWYDWDSDPDDCESFCQPTVNPLDNLDLCDGVDLGDTDMPYVGINNDCDTDGADEDVGFGTDPRNCGRCGNICRVANATPLCEGGECRKGDCADHHFDYDSDTSNGCEYECLQTEGGVELCDNQDNDCDGATDEDDAIPGSPWGAQGGGACYVGEDTDDQGCDTDGEHCKTPCGPGAWKCTPSGLRCEGAIHPAKDEACDHVDNDCDGATDEEEDIPLMGPGKSVCAFQAGACPEGHWRCATDRAHPELGRQRVCCADVDGNGFCVGVRDSAPDNEGTGADQCDGVDNDCDGRIDESSTDENVGMTGPECLYGQKWGNPPNPNLKGRCLDDPGTFRCYYGDWLCEGAVSPASETCNGIDDNCDGATDEGLFRECHEGTYLEQGLCRYGLQACVEGNFENAPCVGEIPPSPERCDAFDNNCDGATDEDEGLVDTDVGQECNTGICEGSMLCVQGAVTCHGGQPPTEELPCNSADDDCDGETDEWTMASCGGCDGNDPLNPSCTLGANEGACQQGTWTCALGSPVCQGETAPSAESCNDKDDDCDGQTDENFNKLADAQNCGNCGVSCDLPHAITRCNNGHCETTGCAFGFVDLDPGAAGCEYECTKTGAEICDGTDNDCDGLTDDDDLGLYRPSNFCRQVGECYGSEPLCSTFTGVWGWYCDYGLTVELAASGNPNAVAIQETLCDDLDNDCDGAIDESFPLKDQPCSEIADPNPPHGICLSTGTQKCAPNREGTICEVTSPGQSPLVESCNGRDDDCDGVIDNGELDEWIAISHHSLSFEIYKYEASRVDATGSGTGISTARSCSKEGVLPWSGATFDQARAACAAAGGQLCSQEEWLAACEGAAPSTAYPYGDTYAASACNGKDYQGDTDVPVATGSLASCLSEDGVFDLSGNLREWTLDPTDTDEVNHVVRGGSFNTPAIGLKCAFTMSRADNDVVLPALGFRCCRIPTP
ncbi:MAG: MopE-related protein [Myxococcota bacterium]|jgi:hypothetical protein|nr:MopE-related protein [Myxococcota bacterium]